MALVRFVIADGQAGAGTSGFQADRVLAQRHTVPDDGDLVSLGGYLAGGSATMRMGLYAADGGEPGPLLAVSADKAVSSTSAGFWSSPLPLATGQKVWIAAHEDGGIDSRGSDGDDQDEHGVWWTRRSPPGCPIRSAPPLPTATPAACARA